MAETKNDRFVRIFVFQNEQKIIKKFIKNFKQRESNQLETIKKKFKTLFKNFIKEKKETLICENGADSFFRKHLNNIENIFFCDCGSALSFNQVRPSDRPRVKPHVCWDKINFRSFELVPECLSSELDKNNISHEECKYILWIYKKKFKKRYF